MQWKSLEMLETNEDVSSYSRTLEIHGYILFYEQQYYE
jgi:hypothetical protein